MIEITQEDYYISAPAEPEEWFMTINLHAQKIEDATATKDIIFESINNYPKLKSYSEKAWDSIRKHDYILGKNKDEDFNVVRNQILHFIYLYNQYLKKWDVPIMIDDWKTTKNVIDEEVNRRIVELLQYKRTTTKLLEEIYELAKINAHPMENNNIQIMDKIKSVLE